jgi:translation initiation factor IF-2
MTETDQIKEAEKKIVSFPSVVPVKMMAEELGVGAGDIIKILMGNGVLATINESVDFDTAAIVAHEFGFEAHEAKDTEAEETHEDVFKEYKMAPRPPVVTIMGHVDHGKTKLLDSIRNTNIIDTESGGITQHIGAYQTKITITENGKKIERQITFLDTPGHEAFSAMRAYGANITDIVILVVAADEGVKPQTIEAISHAKAAKVPIIVAINKIDKPDADPDRVKRELSEHKIIPEEWGGKTPMIPLSAKTGVGIEALLEVIAITADIEGLQAPIDKPGTGMVIESKVQPGKGPVASVIIKEGRIKSGDFLVCGNDFAKIRFMEDWRGNRIKEGLPSDPVLIAGFKRIPKSGASVRVVASEKIAKEISEKLERKDSIKSIAKSVGLGEVSQEAKEGKIKELALIIKADVKGSLDAIKGSLEEITSDDIKINIISDGVGAVTESDINLATASRAVILAFRVPTPPAVMKLSETNKIKISKYDIIYQLIDDVTAALEGMLEPEIVETKIGTFEVAKLFLKTKNKGIVGGKVIKGKITPGTRIDVIRDEEKIGTLKPESIQVGQQKVNFVEAKDECGVSYIGEVKIKPKDLFEFVLVEEHLKSIKKKS